MEQTCNHDWTYIGFVRLPWEKQILWFTIDKGYTTYYCYECSICHQRKVDKFGDVKSSNLEYLLKKWQNHEMTTNQLQKATIR